VSETFSLGRIAGIRVGVNASVLVIVLIIAGGLAFGRFPLVLPGRGAAAYVAAGVAPRWPSSPRCWPTSWPTHWWPGATGSRWRASPCGCWGVWPG
jgi:hypothetical protein